MAYKFNPFTGNLDVTPFSLNGAGKIPSDYLPSYVDDAIEYANLAGFPGTGETGKIYVAEDTGYTYRWTGSVYVRIGSGGAVELNLGSTGSPSLFFNGDVNTGLYSPGADQVAVATNGLERLRITSAGLVGIGTSSPDSRLVVKSSATPATIFRCINSANNINIFQVYENSTGDAEVYIKNTTGAPNIALRATGSSYIIGGSLGIGTTIPSTPLEIASSGTANAIVSAFDATASRAYYQVGGTTSGRYTQIGTDTSTTFINDYFGTGIAFQLAASEKARIDSSGRLLVGTSSDSGGARLQVNDNRIRIATAKTPASASDTGTAGEICWDADYIYVCTATDTWKRTAISTW